MFARKFAAIALAAGVLVSASACSFNPKPESLQSYAPSDGAGADLVIGSGEVIKARNFLYLTDGKTGSLLGTLVNGGAQDQIVSINYTGADGVNQSEEVLVPANGLFEFGYHGAAVSVLKLDGKAGDLGEVSLGAANNSKWLKLSVPLLDSTFEYYKDLVDQLSTPAASDAETAN